MQINKKSLFKGFLFVLIYINSGALWANTQLFKFEYSQEVYLSLLVIWCGFYLVSRMVGSKGLTAEEIFILLLVLFLTVTPALFAYINFDQPLYFGLIEERRALSYLIFFPIYYALSNKVVSPLWIIYSILVVCAINGVNSIFYYLDIRTQYNIDVINSMNVRYDRTMIGAHYMLFAYIYLFFDWLKTRRQINLPFIIAIIVYFFVFVQTKQMLVILLGFSFLLMLSHVVRSIWLVAAVFILFWVAYWVADLGIYYEKYKIIIEAALSGETSIRTETASMIITDMRSNFYIFGKGSLSSLWNNNFSSMFGDNFYLSDVGLLGTYYRFGILAIPLFFIYYSFFIRRYFKLGYYRNDVIPLAAFSFIICSILLNILTPVIEYNGYYMAISLGLLSTYKKSLPSHLRK